MCDEKPKIEYTWEEIGIQLEIDYEKLKNIRHSNHDVATGTKYTMALLIIMIVHFVI